VTFLREWREWWGIAGLFVLFLVFTAAAAYYKAAYIKQHHCVETGSVNRTTIIISDKNGTQVLATESREYVCDGGERTWM